MSRMKNEARTSRVLAMNVLFISSFEISEKNSVDVAG